MSLKSSKILHYFCLWESIDTRVHQIMKHWSQRWIFSGKAQTQKWVSGEPSEGIVPTIAHKIVFWNMEFVTVLNLESAAFMYLQDFFPFNTKLKVDFSVNHKQRRFEIVQ